MNDRPYDEIDPTLESQARDLLTAAAETVDVAPRLVSPPERRPRWPWLVAAVAAVIALIVLLPLLRGAGGKPRPEPTPLPEGAVTVPQTLWMTEQQARETLGGIGLDAVVVDDLTCDVQPGRVTGSRPEPTVRIDPGDTVRLHVAVSSPTFCATPGSQDTTLGLLDLARFGRADLVFAPTVRVFVDGEQTAELTADEARDPTAWGRPSPLSRLVDFVGSVGSASGRVLLPAIRTREVRDGQYACGPADPPPALAGRPATAISVSVPVDGVFGCRLLRVYRDAVGRIDAVTASSDGVGDPVAKASEPAVPGDPTRAQRDVADAFAAYARGGSPPAFAAEVRLLLGNVPVATVSASEATDPATWRLDCEGYGEASCPIDALLPLQRDRPYAVTGTVERERSACHTIDGRLPDDLASSDARARSVSLSAVEPEMCGMNWEIQLWLDGQDRIRAANVVLGSL